MSVVDLAETITKIKKMSVFELLTLAIESPENLVDPYYKDFGKAMRDRYELLRLRRASK